MTRARILSVTAAFVLAAAMIGVAAQQVKLPERAEVRKLMSDGNYKEAYEGFARLALDPKDDPAQVGEDLKSAVSCLRNLGRHKEIDAFLENVIETHADNRRLLIRAAQIYLDIEHYGMIIAGEFERGGHRGGGKYVNGFERDRVRALQLLEQAMAGVAGDDPQEASRLYWQVARALLANRGFQESWRLQYLTDLKTLPDYQEGHYYGHYRAGRGAPVAPDGTPVYHELPKSWLDAQTDGERWRWALVQVVEYAPSRQLEIQYHFATFLHHQFGVQTMQRFRWWGRGDDAGEDESGTYALHTLGEDETIARLATGVKRFTLPDEFDFIRIFKDIARAKQGYQENALNTLAQIFENRRQYEKAVDYWRTSIALRTKKWKTDRLQQIIGNWGQFEPVVTQPARSGATVEFRFRNGRKVTFTAYRINVKKLLDDVKAYLKSNPRQLSWQELQLRDLGWRLVTENRRQYVDAQVAEWSMDLEPRPRHFDKRITVTTPLQKAGAYLLTAKMADGSTSNIVLWVADTVIVQKPMEDRPYYFVADAVTGRPIPKANVEFFGYRQEWIEDKTAKEGRRGGHHVVHTRNFAEYTDADGQLMPRGQDRKYQWVIIATTPEGRMAYLGFTNVWSGRRHDREYNQTKVFTITDRPVYRPEQTVKFKFWVNQAKYDREGPSPFAGRSFAVRINNPKGEKVFEQSYTADQHGGLNGEFNLEDEAPLGVYSIHIVNHGGGSFRVEEYKKPEFEVSVDAPPEPVMLGEKITARIKANYYFGAPVTEAKVKYKILRSGYTARWYPIAYWDWLYGPGYWWFGYDYEWWPGWRDWGCLRPVPWWWQQPQGPPELVAEAEVPIGEDGILEIEIDTALAKEIHGDVDHRYEITAEVTDPSRRTIVGRAAVLVARKPFKVYAWVDRGHYRVGDTVNASFSVHTLDKKPVAGEGVLRLLAINYDKDMKPVEREVQKWKLAPDAQGRARRKIKASRAGQYRISYTVTDLQGHEIEGGYVFVVRGEGFDGSDYRFSDIELVPDKREYAPGETVNLMINVNRPGGWVVLFLRPANGVYLKPKVMQLDGKSALEEIEVVKRDMPNFFVEVLTVSDGRVHTEAREIVVPPEDRVLDVKVEPSAQEYRPGETAKVKLLLTDPTGEPFEGSVVVSIYDKAVEYISGGSNVPDIKKFFWEWRRRHNPRTGSSLQKGGHNVVQKKKPVMQPLGVFGHLVADDMGALKEVKEGFTNARKSRRGIDGFVGGELSAQMAAGPPGERMLDMEREEVGISGAPGGGEAMVEPTVRTKFADTALWVAALATGPDGTAEVELTMPENLTAWKTRVWAMGDGTRVGEGTVEVVTSKNLMLRLQAPRFFVQKDEVVLSANVHNYLDTEKNVRAVLELDGDVLEPLTGALEQTVTVEPNGQKRVDWRVKVARPGEAVVRMKALTDEESDAMEMRFPAYVHGMLKTESYSGVIRPDGTSAAFTITVPAERKPEQSRLEIRYSPTLAGAMVDALPYLADYPYGCTEQTLNRFIPAVITQKALQRMGLDLEEIGRKRTNLNAQEIGDDVERAKQWKRFERNPVFDEELLADMVKAGIERLTSMQCSDGGWGWFSGYGEHSYPHTTAVVVHGLQVARENDVALVPGVLERGIAWLARYQVEQLRLLDNAADKQKHRRWKNYADNLDALVYMVLVDEKKDNAEMRRYLYRDRNHLAVYGKAMFALALHAIGDEKKRDMLMRNVEQFLVQDDENQTAYLALPKNNWWWHWYGSEYEAQAYYLKLLAATDPKGETASRLVKYLVNNRKHATYWKSTRDTAVCIEAFAEYIEASGEMDPDMTLTVLLDGKAVKEVAINRDNLFVFDNRVVLVAHEVTDGDHVVELRREGSGAVYFNAYLTNFTLEDPITRAGLEIKVNRKYYKLTPVEKTVKVSGSRGQAVDQKVEKLERTKLANLSTVKSGDLVEIELAIESKNDYEYIIFEDMKPAGFEPVDLRSGYTGNEMGAYVEFRDERVVLFVRALARGRHSMSYRMRAEIPGRFSALPTKASAMYAPELRANSDEIKLAIED